VKLYKEDKETLIGSAALLETGLVSYTELNYTVPANTSEYIYIKADLRKIGTGSGDTADSGDDLAFRVYSIVAEGEESGETLSAGNRNGTCAAGEICYDTDLDGNYDESGESMTSYTKEFTVVGTRISGDDLVESAGGKSIASSLSEGTNNVAILKIETDETTNTDAEGTLLKTILKQIRLNVDTNATITAMKIERIGGSGTSYDMTATGTSDYVINSAAFTGSNDARIDSGETAYFLVKATFDDFSSAQREYIQVNLKNLDAGNATAGIHWNDGKATTDYKKLRLDYTSVDGIKILEPTS